MCFDLTTRIAVRAIPWLFWPRFDFGMSGSGFFRYSINPHVGLVDTTSLGVR